MCVSGQGRRLENLEFTPRNLYRLFHCLYDVRTEWVCLRFHSGSQVFSADEYPFQDTRYNLRPGNPLCERILVTSYSSLLSISSGGGFMKFGPCSAVL